MAKVCGNTLSLKLLVDNHGKKVLFAEAGKDFVDFLFHIMTLPVGTVVRLLKNNGMMGCLGNLYRSIENMSDVYMESAANKEALLKPKSPSGGPSFPLLLPDSLPTAHKTYYKCNNRSSRPYGVNISLSSAPSSGYSAPSSSFRDPSSVFSDLSSGYSTPSSSFSFSSSSSFGVYTSPSSDPSCPNIADHPNAMCPTCRNPMTQQVVLLESKQTNAGTTPLSGYVKEVVTYMVMDDLVVKPMSTISSINMLNQFRVKDVGALEEKVIAVGMNEAVELLKTSFYSKNVLTDVFFGKV